VKLQSGSKDAEFYGTHRGDNILTVFLFLFWRKIEKSEKKPFSTVRGFQPQFLPAPIEFPNVCAATRLRTTAYGRECEVENLAELDV